MARGLAEYRPVGLRGALIQVENLTVVADCYNANPESMRAALKALVGIAGGRTSWAVLGEMRELGEEALTEHDAIGRLAVRLNVSRLVAVGEEDLDEGITRVHGLVGEESVEGATERVDVGSMVHQHSFSKCLFRSHVAECPNNISRHCHANMGFDASEAKVRQVQLG